MDQMQLENDGPSASPHPTPTHKESNSKETEKEGLPQPSQPVIYKHLYLVVCGDGGQLL